MIVDHTQSTATLKPIAAKAGVTLPTGIGADHKAMAPVMQELSDKEFKTKHVPQLVADHQKTVNTLKAHKTMTEDAGLQNRITTSLPVVVGHPLRARQDRNTTMQHEAAYTAHP